jgi:hypothetical protein
MADDLSYGKDWPLFSFSVENCVSFFHPKVLKALLCHYILLRTIET